MTHAPLLAPDTQVQRPGGVPGSHKDLCPGSRGQCSQHCLVTVRPLAWAAKEQRGCSRGRAAGGGKPGLSSIECAVERRQAAKTGRMGGWGELPLHRGHLNLRTEPDRWQVWEAQGGACSRRAWGEVGRRGREEEARAKPGAQVCPSEPTWLLCRPQTRAEPSWCWARGPAASAQTHEGLGARWTHPWLPPLPPPATNAQAVSLL